MIIFDPITEYTQKYRDEYNEKVVEYFNDLVVRSGVEGEQNRRTLKEYKSFCEKSEMLRKKLTWWRVLRVVLCITILLIPLVIIKINPIIKQLRSNIAPTRVQKSLCEKLVNKCNRLTTCLPTEIRLIL